MRYVIHALVKSYNNRNICLKLKCFSLYLRSILILSFHLRWDFPSFIFGRFPKPKFLGHYISLSLYHNKIYWTHTHTHMHTHTHTHTCTNTLYIYVYIHTKWSKSHCAPDDYNTESYKQCSKCPPPICRHLLIHRTVFLKTLDSH
jgi:hypothetical protein